MSKHYLFLIVFFLSCFYTSHLSAKEKTPEGGWLWKISGNGLQQPSYLFGTWHGTFDILYSYTDSIPGFREAFAACDRFAGEKLLFGRAEPEQSLADIQLPADTTYAGLLTGSEYHFLDSLVQKYLNIPLDRFGYKPDFIYLTLNHVKENVWNQVEEIKKMKQAGHSKEQIKSRFKTRFDSLSSQVMDATLQIKAREKGAILSGLDSTGMELLLFGHDLKEQASRLVLFLRMYFNEPSDPSESTNELVNIYRSQNIKRLAAFEAYSDSLARLTPALDTIASHQQNLLLTGRNRYWMDKIPALIQAGPTFIAVGVRHLPGKDGLIVLLREQGYRVEAVK